MPRKIIALAICTLLALTFLTSCDGGVDTEADTYDNDMGLSADMYDADPTNPIQIFINENHEALNEASEDHLEYLGPDATVDFFARDGEFIYVYTFGAGPTADELKEFAAEFLEYPANVSMYETLAGNFAEMIGIDSLTIIVLYYDAQGNFVASDSYESL